MQTEIYYVYVIQSQKDGRLYVGMTKHINERLKEHNSGQVFSTKSYRPWKLFYSEEIGDRQKAREREKYLKSGCGKEFLKKLYSAIAQR